MITPTTPTARTYRIVERHYGRDAATARHWAHGDDLIEQQILSGTITYWTVIEILPPSTRKPQPTAKFALDGRRFESKKAAYAAYHKWITHNIEDIVTIAGAEALLAVLSLDTEDIPM